MFQSWAWSWVWGSAEAAAHPGQVFPGLAHECHWPREGEGSPQMPQPDHITFFLSLYLLSVLWSFGPNNFLIDTILLFRNPKCFSNWYIHTHQYSKIYSVFFGKSLRNYRKRLTKNSLKVVGKMYIYGPEFSKYIVQMLIRSHSLVRNDWKSLISNIIKNYCGQVWQEGMTLN